jgi:hypothetical protein
VAVVSVTLVYHNDGAQGSSGSLHAKVVVINMLSPGDSFVTFGRYHSSRFRRVRRADTGALNSGSMSAYFAYGQDIAVQHVGWPGIIVLQAASPVSPISHLLTLHVFS